MMLEEIRQWYRQFKADWKATFRTAKRFLTATVAMGALCLAFHGHVFTAVAMGGLTYLLWRNSKGEDQLVDTIKTV